MVIKQKMDKKKLVGRKTGSRKEVSGKPPRAAKSGTKKKNTKSEAKTTDDTSTNTTSKPKITNMSLYDVEKKIRRSHREIDWNTKEGHHRTKVQFLSAIHEDQYEDALELVTILLDHDPMNEMFQQYHTNLEGIVKQQAEDDEGSSEEEEIDDEDEDDSSSSSSSEEEEEEEQVQMPLHDDDEAEKKDDDLAAQYGVDMDAKHTGVTPTLDLANPERGMTPAQLAKLDELKAQFSSLRASVQDRDENEARLWTQVQPAMSVQSCAYAGGAEAKE